ncbi:hypothetical protein HDV05_000526 [Chytridiales sp. JEL 0842]|nr:hypothetical protein HDV05_000526 [Chytridiales sp. JEL 0842]
MDANNTLPPSSTEPAAPPSTSTPTVETHPSAPLSLPPSQSQDSSAASLSETPLFGLESMFENDLASEPVANGDGGAPSSIPADAPASGAEETEQGATGMDVDEAKESEVPAEVSASDNAIDTAMDAAAPEASESSIVRPKQEADLPSVSKILASQEKDIKLPTYSSWFSFSKIDDIERKALPEFFNNKNKSKTPQVYKDYRDFMINTYRLNPTEYLTITACRRNLVGDVCAIMRVHSFLDQWGLINYQVDPDSRPSAIGPAFTGHFRVTADTPRGLQPFGPAIPITSKDGKKSASEVFAKVTLPTLPASVTSVVGTTVPQKRTSDGVKIEGASDESDDKKPKKYCQTCSVDCTNHFYTTTSSTPVEICKNCFLDGRFSSTLHSSDFIRVEERITHHADNAPWSDQETLLLLEGLEMFDDNWAKIAEHVGTRTKEQCIHQFLDLPIVDPYVDTDKPEKLGPLQFDTAPFSGVDNPVMSVVAMLASIIPPEVAKAAAKAAVGESSAVRKKQKVVEGAETEKEKSAVPVAGEVKEKEDGMDIDEPVASSEVVVKTEEGGADASKEKAEIEEKAQAISESASAALDAAADNKGKPLTTLEKAAAIALGAAAAKASTIAANEAKEARRIVSKIIELQIQKLELKLKHFEDIEAVVDAERAEVERERKILAVERANLKRERASFFALKTSMAAAGASAAAIVQASTAGAVSKNNYGGVVETPLKPEDRVEQGGLAVMSIGAYKERSEGKGGMNVLSNMLLSLLSYSTLSLAALCAIALPSQAQYPAPYGVPPPFEGWNAQYLQGALPSSSEPDILACNDSRSWAFTFDDGPSSFTPTVLDYLAQANTTATFFVVGSQLAASPEARATLLRAYNEGHQIAHHSWSHSSFLTLTNEQIVAEVMWTGKIVMETIGQFPRYVRPPYGEIDGRVRSVLKAMNLEVVLWNADTNDWQLEGGTRTPSQVQAVISNFAANPPSSGVVSLQHDLAGIAVNQIPLALATHRFNMDKLFLSTQTNSHDPLQSAPERIDAYLARHVQNICSKQPRSSSLPSDAPNVDESNQVQFPFYVQDDDAAVVIVDLSELTTALSEALGGSATGADKLRQIINPYFELLVETCVKYGGDVFKFAGDSMMVTPATEALKCTMELLEVFSKPDELLAKFNLPTLSATSATNPMDNIDCRLSIHIGLGFGYLQRAHVGIPGIRRECFLEGQALRDASECLDKAKKGEFCMTQKALELLEAQDLIEEEERIKCIDGGQKYPGFAIMDHISGSVAFCKIMGGQNDAVLLKTIIPRIEATSPFTPTSDSVELAEFALEYINESMAHLLKASIEDQSTGINMLRRMSVVFIKLGEFPKDDPASAIRLAQSVMETIIPSLRKYQGTMRQFCIDDKGATVLLVWGLPPFNHERDALFALKAAIEMKESLLPLLGSGFSIGVTTGTIFTGSIGSMSRSDHSILGRAVNEAARLMCDPLSKGSILCDRATFEETCDTIGFRSSERKIMIKGRSDPMDVYIPSPSKNGQGKRISKKVNIVGRASEKEKVGLSIQHWARQEKGTATDSVPLKIILSGESGLGKTAIGEYFIQEVQRVSPRAMVCSARASEDEKSTPYLFFKEFFEILVRKIDGLNSDRAQAWTTGSPKSSGLPLLKQTPASIDLEGKEEAHHLSLQDIVEAPATDQRKISSSEPSLSPNKPCANLFSKSNLDADSGDSSKNSTASSSTSGSTDIVSESQSKEETQFQPVVEEKAEVDWFADLLEVTDKPKEGQFSNLGLEPTIATPTPRSAIIPVAPSIPPSPSKKVPNRDSVQETLQAVETKLRSMDSSKSEHPHKETIPFPLSVETSTAKPLILDKKPFFHPLHAFHPLKLSSNSNRNSPRASQDLHPSGKKGPISLSASPRDSTETINKTEESILTVLKRVVVHMGESWRRARCILELFEGAGSEGSFNGKEEGESPVQSPSKRTKESSTLRKWKSMVVKWINKLTDVWGVSVALCFDDCQWQDSFSWQLTAEIVKNCPKVLMLLSTRPLNEYEPTSSELVKPLLSDPRNQLIELRGLGHDDAHDLLLQILSAADIESVEPKLEKEIVRQTSGNCYIISTLAHSIVKSFEKRRKSMKPSSDTAAGGDAKRSGIAVSSVSSALIITEDHVLRIASDKPLSEIINLFLPTDANILVSQYDKLNDRLRRILAIASCLGHHFTLKTLWSICQMEMSENVAVHIGQLSPNTLHSFIRSEDTYGFISNEHEKPTDDVTIGAKNSLSFRHLLIQKAIYDQLVETDRQEIHKHIATHFIEACSMFWSPHADAPSLLHSLSQAAYHLERVSPPGLRSSNGHSLVDLLKMDVYIKLLEMHHQIQSAAEGLKVARKLEELGCWREFNEKARGAENGEDYEIAAKVEKWVKEFQTN